MRTSMSGILASIGGKENLPVEDWLQRIIHEGDTIITEREG